MIFHYQYDGQPASIRLERQPDGSYRATIGDRVYTVRAQPLNDGGWLLALDDRRVVVYGAAAGGARFLSLDGLDYTLVVPERRGASRKRPAGGGGLTAQMPGQVMAVLVDEGQTVERGQTLVVLEAMKMEIRVSAPGNGRVKSLLVRQGDVVERGQRLLEIE